MNEKERAEHSEQQLSELQCLKQQLMEELKQYQGMEQQVKKIKENVTRMFKKLAKGKTVPEQENPEHRDFMKKMEELVNELEVRKIEVRI